MTRILECYGASVEGAVDAPFIEHRLLRWLMPSWAPAIGSGVAISDTSLSDRSDLADLAFASTHTSGQCAVFLNIPTYEAESAEPVATRFQFGVLGLQNLQMLRLAALTYDLGHGPFVSGLVILTSGKCDVLEDVYICILRNTMAHTFPNPREEEHNEVAIKASGFLSGLYRIVEDGEENAAGRLIYSAFHQFRQRQEYELCDRILQDADVKRLPPVLLVAMLTITTSMKKQPRKRAGFFARSKIEIARLRGALAAERIVIGLE
jgi:hypothetical protein